MQMNRVSQTQKGAFQRDCFIRRFIFNRLTRSANFITERRKSGRKFAQVRDNQP